MVVAGVIKEDLGNSIGHKVAHSHFNLAQGRLLLPFIHNRMLDRAVRRRRNETWDGDRNVLGGESDRARRRKWQGEGERKNKGT